MSLAVAVPAALASAVAYGASTAVQHTVVGELDDTQPTGLLSLLRNPRWWLSILGDTVGLTLQLIALSTGPVVLIQPLFVLCLPIALPIRARLGGPRPTPRDFMWSAVLGGGLGVFFIVSGNPGSGRALTTAAGVGIALVALAAGSLAVLGTLRSRPLVRAMVLSAVAGCWFGVEAVLVNAASVVWRHGGLRAFGHPVGLVPLISLIVLGVLGFVLTHVAFSLGSIAASFPATLVADPIIAVALGAGLLNEAIRDDALALVGYVICLAMIVLATVRLAAPLEKQVGV